MKDVSERAPVPLAWEKLSGRSPLIYVMNKSLLSQLLDGAACPAMMIAIAVSQIKVDPQQTDTIRQGKRQAAELQVGNRVEQKAKEAQGR